MIKREDGKETRQRLLKAACELFAQKGYPDTKVADICRRAGANVASVKYYFASKANLYSEAWRYAIQDLEESVVSESNAGSAQDRLHTYIRNLMQNFTAEGRLGQFARLYLMELIHPTGLIQDAWHELIEVRRRKLQHMIRDVIGPEADDVCVLFCELSIINQCRSLVTIKRSDLEYMLGQPLSPALVQKLAGHIADFSLAGVQAVGKLGEKPV